MKTCTKCGVEKLETEFYSRKDTRDGLCYECKVCSITRASKWARANPEKCAGYVAKWAKANPEKKVAIGAASSAKWDKANPEKKSAFYSRWARANPEKCAALRAKHEAQKIQATPGWINQGYIDDVYRKAAIFTRRDGKLWHVDHIVPLRSKLVCGLHCEDNLQTMPGKDNMSKGNRRWPDMPSALSM